MLQCNVRLGKQPIWNSGETDPGWLNFNIGNILAIIKKYSFTFCITFQYFVVLSNPTIINFQAILNKLKKVVSLHFEIKYAFIQRATRRFWKVLRHINSYVSNKWLLKLPCVYLNTQESSRTETLFKRIQDG
ncbi:hypothetical protein T07_12775 [Trichinella nelsoni]|uniref:Uncharacterized protein n=1 Tax=Trichinella nelsoni TaxID=6336 RepID=A0A0V0S4W0_9BILA|nr:hypothetical protein T07_12775 [Trichinella nelsoni]